MKTQMRDLWRAMTRTRYTRSLEAEVARLREENRALLNSILGVAGIPPIVVSELTAEATGPMSDSGCGGKQVPPNVAPLRKRSWQQINRMLEIQSARRAEGGRLSGAPAVRDPNQ